MSIYQDPTLKMSGRGAGGGRGPSATWNRLKPTNVDPLEAVGLPSKGDKSLLNHKTQEQYYTKIVDRYMAFCSSAGRGDELLRRMNALSIQPPSTAHPSMGPPLKPAPKPSQGLAASRWADDPEPPKSKAAGPPKPKASSMTNRHKPQIGAYTLAQAQKSTPTLTSNTPRSSTSTTSAPLSNNTNLSSPPNPPPNYDVSSQTLSVLTMSMRKLREGILASHRCDAFTTQVYIFIIRLSILLKQWESYHPALLHLLHSIHPRRPLSKLELSEFAGYLVLDLACRQDDLAGANEMRVKYELGDGKVSKVVKVICYDDYVGFWRLMRSVDGHKAKIMEYAEEGMRVHALKCVGRAYFQVPKSFVEHTANAKWEVLVYKYKVGWELNGEEVVMRKVKGK